MLKIMKFIRDSSGVTSIQYGLMAALLSSAVIGGTTAMGGQLNYVFAYITGVFTGDTIVSADDFDPANSGLVPLNAGSGRHFDLYSFSDLDWDSNHTVADFKEAENVNILDTSGNIIGTAQSLAYLDMIYIPSAPAMTIENSVPTIPGESYTVTFLARNYDGTGQAELSIGGEAVLQTSSTRTDGFVQYSHTFVASSVATHIGIQDIKTNNDFFGAFVADVEVTRDSS